MTSAQMNKFLIGKDLPEHHKFIAIEGDGQVFSYTHKPSFKYIGTLYASWVKNKLRVDGSYLAFIGWVEAPKNPELELYTYE